MKSHVYLLRHRNGLRFKIGKANNIIRRARNFGLQDIDWDSSIGLEVSDEREAFRLERILLRAFEKCRLTAQEVVDDDGVLDGATEWMDAGSFARVDLFLQQGTDLFPHARITGARLREEVIALTASAIEKIAKRAHRKAEKLARSEALAARKRADDAAADAALTTALRSAKDVLWQELLRHLDAGTIIGMATESNNWYLVLMGQDLGQDERIWRPSLRGTEFNWPRGAGNLVNSFSEYRSADVRVCFVCLSDSFYSGRPSREVVLPALAEPSGLLQSLPLVDLGGLSPTSDMRQCGEPWFVDTRTGLHEFFDTHLPILQSRQAARLSMPLF
ncbi:GIY-YIG nuclease family protein [Leeia aquatica]|uniref:Uncharacterized protein n=1 Tax=Leeia aquatica TaxID=2725557 RepID=A0A847SEC0_9NEIS|nr:GIY-YIG nuclease family protein [Leeia aquatica]NLR74302.1 hypothetical protein [Leeia aquatica]